MTNLSSLKKLAASIIGDITPDDVPGKTVAEVINYLAKFKTGEVLGELTLTSTAGTTVGTTKITVSPTITSGNSYVYKISPSSVSTPEYLDDSSDLTVWNGTDEITVENSHFVAIYEVNSSKQILKFGQVKAKTNFG